MTGLNSSFVTFECTRMKAGICGSLLEAGHKTPLTVTGRLDHVEDIPEALFISHQHVHEYIEIGQVQHFAYGQYEDGEIAIWAAGKAGWFDLQPAPEYKEIYEQMVEAIGILYFVADRYRKCRRRGNKFLKFSVESIFDQYPEYTNYRCADAEEAAAIIYKHKNFLLSTMAKGNEDIQWSKTPFFQHLMIKFPDDYTRIKAEVTENKLYLQAKELSPDPSSSDTAGNIRKRKRTHGERTDEKASSHRRSSSSADNKGEVLFNMLEKARNSKRFNCRKMGLKDFAYVVCEDYQINSVTEAEAVLMAWGPQIRSSMEQDRLGGGVEWTKVRIYKELGSTRLSQRDLKWAQAIPLEARPLGSESSDDQDNTVIERRKRSAKGALRLKASKYTPKRRDSPMDVQSDYDSDQNRGISTVLQLTSPSRRKPSQTGTNVSDLIFPMGLNRPPRTGVYMPLRIVKDPVPSMAPNRPGDVWICTYDGCSYKAYAASTERGEKLISGHLKEHFPKKEKQLELVYQEQRPHLPVGNLINRIRELAAEHNVSRPTMGESFPKPIRRKV